MHLSKSKTLLDLKMESFDQQKFALIYSLPRKAFEIEDVKRLVWKKELFEGFLHGDKIYTTMSFENCPENVLILQTAENAALLNETKLFCVALRKKKKAIAFIRDHFNPLRGRKRQHLPPVEVRLKSVMHDTCYFLLVLFFTGLYFFYNYGHRSLS